MRSNPSCVVCNCTAKEQINKLMYNGATAPQVRDILLHQLTRAEKEFSRWNVEYQSKRTCETLTDEDIAEKNRRLAAIEAKTKLADLTLEQLEEHVKHAAFRPNQCFKQPELDDNDVLENVNFTQLKPGTIIGENVTDLVFKQCNMLNCTVPEDAVQEKCLKIQKSFCSHLHPEWNFEQECEQLCEHVSKYVPELVLDGVVVAREIVNYEDKVVE